MRELKKDLACLYVPSDRMHQKEAEKEAQKKETGTISQIIGPVLDIEFPNGELPKVYNALIIKGDKANVTCEVQQLLGNNKVRAVSMTSTDGLRRDAHVIDTSDPINSRYRSYF